MSAEDIGKLNPHLDLLAQGGPNREKAAQALRESLSDGDQGQAEAVELAKALETGLEDWDDAPAAQVIDAVGERIRSRSLEPDALASWIAAHPNDAGRVSCCLQVNPPATVEITEVLSDRTAQKIVYRARWQGEREIVLKQLLDQPGEIVARELLGHPFSMVHPNIIETHLLINDEGQEFLAERLVRPLDDEWRAEGSFEAANLLHDIASALEFVHERGRVHGDIKPDNIGSESGRYILLDFGVCRPQEEFAGGDPSGTLRTRAPEVLTRAAPQSGASDIWAIAATVFQGRLGRFPLYEEGEVPPLGLQGEERDQHEKDLAERSDKRLEELVVEPLRAVYPPEFAAVMIAALSPGSNDRPAARELAARCRAELAPLVRAADGPGRMTGASRLKQLQRHLPANDEELALLPERRRQELEATLDLLAEAPELASTLQQEARQLAERLRGLPRAR